MAYVAQAEHLNKDELKEFDVNLPQAPGSEKKVSHGTDALLSMYEMGRG